MKEPSITTYTGAFGDVVAETDTKGHIHEYLSVRDSVLIVAETATGDIIVVEVERRPHDSVFIEFPGGGVEPGETAIRAGQRELLEETGYYGSDWTHAYTIVPSSAWSTERCHVVTTRAATRKTDVETDGEVEAVRLLDPPSVLSRLLAGGADACAIAAWLLISTERNG